MSSPGELLREYVAFGGQKYAVFFYSDLGVQNEVTLLENESLDAAASRLYASLSQPSQAPAPEQSVSQESAQIEIYNASRELVFP